MAGKWFRSIVPRQDAPAEIDTGLAHPARIYNYWLGGKDNFAADREAGDRAVEANPDILRGVRANRVRRKRRAASRGPARDEAATREVPR